MLGSWNLIYEPDRELMTQNGQETGHNSLVQSNRYRFLDGLRGLAALGVVMAHVASHSQDLVSTGIPSGLIAVLYQGKFGVEVLFVISGFVIAHTTRDVNNLRSTFNFLLRRQVRLDPVYWLVTASTVALYQIVGKPMSVTFYDLIVNLLYLHRLFRAPEITFVAWSLCLEVQCYLVFAATMLLAMRVESLSAGRVSRPLGTMILCSLLMAVSLSLFPYHHLKPYFIGYWYFFAGGALCNWCFSKVVHPLVCLFFFCAVLACAVLIQDKSMAVGGATMLIVMAAVLKGKLDEWLAIKPLLYTGKVSYSLYLTHGIVLAAVLNTSLRVLHVKGLVPVSLVVLAGIAVSFVVAHILYISVERPCLMLSNRIKSWQKS